jgi:hypothetical protein
MTELPGKFASQVWIERVSERGDLSHPKKPSSAASSIPNVTSRASATHPEQLVLAVPQTHDCWAKERNRFIWSSFALKKKLLR